MPPTSLSPYPDLEQLKKQAKDLRKAHAAGSLEAAKRSKAYVGRLSSLDDEQALKADLALRDAQHVIAREHGFAGWQDMLKVGLPKVSPPRTGLVSDSVAYSEDDLLPVQILQVEIVDGAHGDKIAAVVLKGDHDRIVLFVVGEPEGLMLSYHIEGRRFPRPLTHDLLTTCLDVLQSAAVAVVIHELREDCFLAHIVFEVNGERKYVDARPSDSVNIAVRQSVPIFVTRSLMDQVGQPLSSLPETLKKMGATVAV